MNSNKSDHVKSGYFLDPSLHTRSCGGLTTLSSFGHTKYTNDLRSLSLFTTALCRQLLYLPLHNAYNHKIHFIIIIIINHFFIFYNLNNNWSYRYIIIIYMQHLYLSNSKLRITSCSYLSWMSKPCLSFHKLASNWIPAEYQVPQIIKSLKKNLTFIIWYIRI